MTERTEWERLTRTPLGAVVDWDEIDAYHARLLAERDRLRAALENIAVAPCLSALLGEDDCEATCPGCRARRALEGGHDG